MVERPNNQYRYRQHEGVDLIESANRYVKQLEDLKEHAVTNKASHFTSDKKAILNVVQKDAEGSIVSLKEWRAVMLYGRQTLDEDVIQTVAGHFEQLENGIQKAEDALKHRLCLRMVIFNMRSRKKEANGRVTKALSDISVTIGQLQSQVKTVVVDTPDQQELHTRINDVVHRRTPAYRMFETALAEMTAPDRQSCAFGVLPILWKALPRKRELAGKVANPDDPGDGVIYTPQEVKRARDVLQDYYEAWSDVVVRSGPASSDKLPNVRRLTTMAKICLILHGMEREGLLEQFCRHNKEDINLPLETHVLEDQMGLGRRNAATFAAEQYRAVCRPWKNGEHIEIPEEEPLPLRFEAFYASGSFGTVQRLRDVVTEELYARKLQTAADGKDHLLTEIEGLKKLQHRHIIQFVKSYQRGPQFGLLLRPAATTDLERLLGRFWESRNDQQNHSEVERKFRPIILKAFGCLSLGLLHIHGHDIRHKDIKLNNILYERALTGLGTARFLWADFGLAYYFGNKGYSKTCSTSEFSRRCAAPESIESHKGSLDAKMAQARSVNADTDEERESSEECPQLSTVTDKTAPPEHGRSADIFSYGCVFLQILATLTGSSIPNANETRFVFCDHVLELQGWVDTQVERLQQGDPLAILFCLARKMIRYEAKKRPKIAKIVSTLADSQSAEQFFCTSSCLEEARQAVVLEAKRTGMERQSTGHLKPRPASPEGKTSEESGSGTGGISDQNSEEDPSKVLAQRPSKNGFLSPNHVRRSPAMR
ncbi:MAG: hypothetical protein Q9163_002696 [Psora crenata]